MPGEELNTQTKMKTCPYCSQELPISEFGVCRARKDGRNLYCKRCICKKITARRQAAKDRQQRYRTSNTTGAHDESVSSRKLTPIERVRDAIAYGARTQQQIAQQTRLGREEIGYALATLLVWTREIGTKLEGETRTYFAKQGAGVQTRIPKETLDSHQESEAEADTSFSSLRVLMPGKQGNGSPHRSRGWIAS
jgi:hypothetical protein